MNETTVKYLAGLLDADGCLSFESPFSEGGNCTLHARLTLKLNENGSRRLMEDLSSEFSVPIKRLPGKKKTHSDQLYIRVNKLSELERIVPRLVKHMHIKAKYWEWILETVRSYRGLKLSKDEVEAIKQEAKVRRKDTGPKKSGKRASWAWIAGFMDGDGHYSCRHQRQRYAAKDGKITYHIKMTRMMQVELHRDDKPALDALIAAIGGDISTISTRPNLLRWRLLLGKQRGTKALSIFSRLVKYSSIKKHKLESLIHDIRSQRLSNQASTEEAIVQTI